MKSFARLHLQYFHVRQPVSATRGRSGQHRKRPEVHGDNCFRLQQFAGIGGFARRHGEMVADRQHGNLRRVELANDGHVAKDIGVAGVVNLDSVGELEHVAAGFAAIDDLVAILNAAGVNRVNHGDLHIADGLRAALVHGRDLLHALFFQPRASSEMPTTTGLCFLPISTASPM